MTIDINLQNELYNAYQQDKSASVAMNPSTGEILALVSTPSFNSNDFILGMSVEKWDELNNHEMKPLNNRFKATFVPGSSMKPITGAIGLDTNSLDKDKDFGAEMKWQKASSWGSYYVTTLHAPEPNNLKNALITHDILTNQIEIQISLRGRIVASSPISIKLLPAYSYLAMAGNPETNEDIDTEMAGIFMKN